MRTELAAGSGPTVLPSGHVYFTASADQGISWSRPVAVGPGAGAISSRVTWIDAAQRTDAAGTLYATWDTQHAGGDNGHGHVMVSWGSAVGGQTSQIWAALVTLG